MATYRETGVDFYDREPNPVIMALPAIKDDLEAIQAMAKVVVATEAQRAKPSHLRLHELGAIDGFFQPLDDHVDLCHRISGMLRAGYVGRNPTLHGYVQAMDGAISEADRLSGNGGEPVFAQGRGISVKSLVLVGMSGVGKTRAALTAVASYPPVIEHPELTGPFRILLQVPCLYVVCPEDASQKGLLIAIVVAFDRRLGTNYERLYVTSAATVNSLRSAVTRLAFLHGLGMLIIDECQHLNNAKAGGAQVMIDFFKIFAEVTRVAILLVGTEEVEKKLSHTFQAARRHSGLPLFGPMPLHAFGEEGRLQLNRGYKLFYDNMFKAQYLRQPISADEELLTQLHRMTFGIPGIDVKLFALTQVRALSIGLERLHLDLFRQVYDDCFKPLHAKIEGLRNGIGQDAAGWAKSYEEFMADPGVADLAGGPGNAPSASAGSAASGGGREGASVPEDDGVDGRPEFDDRSGLVLTELLVRGAAEGRSGHDSLDRGGFIRAIAEELPNDA